MSTATLYEGQTLGASGEFVYSRWRHGGWYVDNVRYPSGAVGCVTRQLVPPGRSTPDGKWRIACDERRNWGEKVPRDEWIDHTYPSRDAAAAAERDLIAQAA